MDRPEAEAEIEREGLIEAEREMKTLKSGWL